MTRPHSRATALVLLSALVLLVAAGPATAQTAARYHTKAEATGLDLKVFGQGITLGLAQSSVADQPVAAGRGVGAILPGDQFVTDQPTQVAGTDGTQATENPPACGPITLPPDFPIIDLATACASGSSAIAGGLPTAAGEGSVATIDVNAAELAPVTDAVSAPVGQLIDGLKPVFDALDQADIDADTLIKDIVGAITEGGDIVRIRLGQASATSGATAETATSSARAQGAVIEVLPRDLLQLDPVITIEVGASTADISVNRASGEPTVTFDPALVRVTLADDIAATLPAGVPNPIEIAPGVSQCLGLPAPLDSCITVAGGTTGQRDDEDKTNFGESAGVSLHLLTGVQDGVRLDLARTVVEGFAISETPRVEPPVETPLARTGGSTPLALMALVIGIGFAGAAITRTARREHLA